MIMRRTTPSKKAKRLQVAPRILSSEEKRELILAHAAARQPIDPVQRFSLWAGVTVCLIFVVGAWAYTAGSGIRKSLAGPVDANLQGALDATKEIGKGALETGGELGAQINEVSKQLGVLAEQEALIQQLAAEINATSTRSDRFQSPAGNATSSHPTTTTP